MRGVGDCGTIITRVAQGIGITVRLVGVVGIDTVIATIADRVTIGVCAADIRSLSVAIPSTLYVAGAITSITHGDVTIVTSLRALPHTVATCRSVEGTTGAITSIA